MNEYEYLEWLVQERYFAEVETNVDPIGDRINAELKSDRDRDKIAQLEGLSSQAHQQAWENKLRSLDILHWIELDSELRAEGSPSYPDCMERKSEPPIEYSDDLEEF